MLTSLKQSGSTARLTYRYSAVTIARSLDSRLAKGIESQTGLHVWCVLLTPLGHYVILFRV